jgi:hypothetical protein
MTCGATDPERVALVLSNTRLAMAAAPCLMSFALVGAGADEWAVNLGSVVSTLLLIPYVREARAPRA